MAHVSAIDPLHSVEHITVPEVRFLTRIREEERIHRSVEWARPATGSDSIAVSRYGCFPRAKGQATISISGSDPIPTCSNNMMLFDCTP